MDSDGWMKRRRDDERAVYRSLAMITQFGLNMILPICAMSALGVWLDGKLGTSYLTVVLFAVGAVAGGQNIYRMAKRIYSDEEQAGTQETDNENSGRIEEKK